MNVFDQFSFIPCSSANKCLLKVAQYAAQQENFDKAIEIYEQVGKVLHRGGIIPLFRKHLKTDLFCGTLEFIVFLKNVLENVSSGHINC